MTESEKRRLNVILEEMNGKLSLVLEGHAALDEKIERYHREAREDHRLVMDLLRFSHDELNKKIEGVEQRLDAKIDSLGKELKKTREELSAKMDVVGEKVEGHEERIATLERKVA